MLLQVLMSDGTVEQKPLDDYLAGDHKYGSRDDIRSPALWSFRLTLPHPATGETITCLHPPEGELWHMFPMISREIPRW